MSSHLNLICWLACVVYSTVPSFWVLIHPFAEYWRARRPSPYLVLLPAWMAMWVVVALFTLRWRTVALYSTAWPWVAAVPGEELVMLEYCSGFPLHMNRPLER